MTDFSGFDARVALVTFFGANAAQHPEMGAIIARTDWLSSVIEGVEYLYAKRAELGADGIELLGDLARFIAAHGFHGKGERGAIIAGVAARMAGGGNAEVDGDPEIEAIDAAENPQPEAAGSGEQP